MKNLYCFGGNALFLESLATEGPRRTRSPGGEYLHCCRANLYFNLLPISEGSRALLRSGSGTTECRKLVASSSVRAKKKEKTSVVQIEDVAVGQGTPEPWSRGSDALDPRDSLRSRASTLQGVQMRNIVSCRDDYLSTFSCLRSNS